MYSLDFHHFKIHCIFPPESINGVNAKRIQNGRVVDYKTKRHQQKSATKSFTVFNLFVAKVVSDAGWDLAHS